MSLIMKILSLNVKGLNSPQKRKRVSHFLEKQKADITCLQETHLRKKDSRLAKNAKLGKEYLCSIDKAKRGIIIYVKHHLESRQIFCDSEGHFLGVEIIWNSVKILLLGIYGPQEGKSKFFKKFKRTVEELDYINIIMLGDFNGVVDPQKDRCSRKKIKESQGKLPQSFFDFIDDWNLIEIWRHLYENQKNYTFYSERHESFSRIDLFFVSSSLISKVEKMDILNSNISDHNPIVLKIKEVYRNFNWRLNEELLKDKDIVNVHIFWVLN